MLQEIKTALRISNNAFDGEIEDMIAEARMDLIQSGLSSDVVNKAIEPDPLIKRAIKTYCKANFGLDSPDAERFQASYEMLKQHLSLAGDYNGRQLV
ncbi:head-tail connector protein [Halalkalibacterium ligniniphilum]|uniref:head-tail connector protein n=1 Tax=Halalkalibacterium ligniniphilum TaxID=1134413 RepID=UPI000349E7AA|nr:head-tail connector protein [Halalkalibacterium ligniniphilum]